MHSPEHGVVWITYNGTATAGDIRQLVGKVTRTPYTLKSTGGRTALG